MGGFSGCAVLVNHLGLVQLQNWAQQTRVPGPAFQHAPVLLTGHVHWVQGGPKVDYRRSQVYP